MARRKRKKRYNPYAVSILAMSAVILILCIVIGIKLFSILTYNPLKEENLQEMQAVTPAADGSLPTYAYILTTQEGMDGLSEKKFRKFAEDTVAGSAYAWIAIDFQDGTGIVFTGSDTSQAAYGYLDENRCISEVFGYITLRDGTYRYTAL